MPQRAELSLSVRSDMRAEVYAFVRRGIDINEAAKIVGLSRRHYYCPGGSKSIGHLPTPDEIAVMAEAIRSGEVIVSRTSAKRWEVMRNAQEYTERLSQFDLAGRIAEDACPVPQWLFSSNE